MPHLDQGAVYNVLAERVGGPVREQDTVVAVGVLAVEVRPRDSERFVMVFVNVGATTIHVAPFPNVSTARGIRLAPSGGTVAFNINEDGSLPAVDWFAISDAAGGSLYALEVRRETAFAPEG